MTTTNFLSSTETARRYGVGTDLLRQWRRYDQFPQEAVERRGATAFWDIDRVDGWLRSREVRAVGRPARWLAVVGHPSLELARLPALTARKLIADSQ